MNKKCTNCGAENPVDAVFCDNCGNQLPAQQAAPPPPMPVQPAPQPVMQTPPVQPAMQPPPQPQPAMQTPAPAPETLTPQPASAPAPQTPVAAQMITATPASQPPPPNHPRLVVAASGMFFDISGRAEILLGRVDPYSQVFPEIDLAAHGGDEGGVSRKHCRITLAGNQYFADDLGSSNGTWIGANKLSPNVRTELHNGDQLRLGKVVLNFYTG